VIGGTLAVVALLLGLIGPGGAPSAAGLNGYRPPSQPTPQADLGVPAEKVTLIGASPREPGAPGADETWGLGESNGEATLVRYYVHPSEAVPGTQEGSWTDGPALPAGFSPGPSETSGDPLEGQIEPEGYGVLVGTVPKSGSKTGEETLLVRKPGGGFQVTPSPATEVEGTIPLGAGHTLLSSTRWPMMAPLHEPGGEAGALIAPVDEEEGGAEEYVLHWDGNAWTRERIEIPGGSIGNFHVLALAATSPTNAWLLARVSGEAHAVALFHRVKEGSEWVWQPVEAHVPGGGPQLRLPVPVGGGGEPPVVTAPQAFPLVKQQSLTVTEDGVWVDGGRTGVEGARPYATVFVRPEGGGATVEGSWCNVPEGAAPCLQGLPQVPPMSNTRSIAWPGPGFGTRVITGLPEGVSLTLSGSTFSRVLSLGGGAQEGEELFTPGAHFGAAFSSPEEGWLGQTGPPIHLTTAPQGSRMQPWPVAFRHPLLAIAPQPGAPVGALGSEAVAVGESGAVARYKPGVGGAPGAWAPETLGIGNKIRRPILDAVAWPTANRVYAVGFEGEMWLWRGETGFWEPDPATPINFQDNLLGIAFDPGNPARGYAVGTSAVGRSGVILRYGKTWTAEPVPPEVQGAGFTAIAFAGHEALVAYASQQPGSATELGGLLVNGGSGWAVEPQTAGFGEGFPKALAALPDGGAAVLWHQRHGGDVVWEREGPGAPWHAAPGSLPVEVSGSVSLFREGGALRAIVTGGTVGLATSIGAGEVTPGSPPFEGSRPGVAGGPGAGSVLRQTANGWSDQRHEADAASNPGGYSRYDGPYRPDAVFATLPEAGGGAGWTVGGEPSGEEDQQTADVERYAPAGSAPVQPEATPGLEPESKGITTYAFGGNAQCSAPCADRSFDRVEPQVALSSAVQLAAKIGVHAFFDTGPTITANEVSVSSSPPPVPYQAEFTRDAEVLGSEALSGNPMSVFTAPTRFELDEGSLGAYSQAGFPGPFGTPAGGLERVPAPCACGAYALSSAHVITIVLDDSQQGQVEAGQRIWLEERLQEAGRLRKPAIVVGNPDLPAQLAPGQSNHNAELLFAALTGQDPDGADPGPGGGKPPYVASAYFYDAVEQNISKVLSFRGRGLPVFGSGTLGYESPGKEKQEEFHGAKGILLGEVLWGATAGLTEAQRREYEALNRAVVRVRLVPVVGELALEAKDGLIIQRSHPALFAGLARKPRSGCRLSNNTTVCPASEQSAEGRFIPIPSICVGQTCAEGVLPEYEFTSSRPDIGGFVEVNTAGGNARSVLQNPNHEPVKAGFENQQTHEQLGSHSALFCAYNKGETVVGIRAGGLSYSLTVQVQAGSVRQPCGTVPVREHPESQNVPASPPPPPSPSPTPNTAPPAATPPPVVPLPPAPTAVIPPARVAQPFPFLPPAAIAAPLIPFVPPPLPTPARPTPPSGTSAVTSPVQAVEKEEEEEEATESVSNQAVAYRADEGEPTPLYVLGVIVLAAFAGASVGRRRRGRRRGTAIAPATITGSQAQRRMSGGRRPWEQ